MKKALTLTVPVLENLRPVLHNLDPFLQYLGEYLPELQSFFANVTAATEATEVSSDLPTESGKLHDLTGMQVLTPESLAIYQSRIGTNRADAYPHSGAYSSLAGGLPVFSSSACANSAPSVSGPGNEIASEALIELLTAPHPEKEKGLPSEKRERQEGESPVANEPGTANRVPAPSCAQQSPFTFNGETSQFPHAVYKEK